MTSLRFLNFDGLANLGVSDFLRPNNELSACKNVYCYQIGKLEKVPGTVVIGNNTQVTSESVVYMHHYYQASTRTNYLYVFSNNAGDLDIKYTTGGSNGYSIPSNFSSLSSDANTYISAVNYLDKMFVVGWKSDSTISSSISSSVSNSASSSISISVSSSISTSTSSSLSPSTSLSPSSSASSSISPSTSVSPSSSASSSASSSISPSSSLSPSPAADTDFIRNATINGTVYSTSDQDITITSPGDINMPQGKFIVRYRDLLYVLYTYLDSTLSPNRAYYCNDPVSGHITWDSTNFIDFGYDDGDEITGGIEVNDRLIVFKQFSMWKWDETERKFITGIGCDSYRSILLMENLAYWFNRNGIYRYDGSTPQLISSKVQKFIEAIDQTKLIDVFAVKHEFEYRLFIGDVIVDGISYKNTWLCFDIRRETWYIRCVYRIPTAGCTFIESGIKRAYFGTTNGYIEKFATKVDEVYADSYFSASYPGYEIDSFAITNNLDFGQAENTKLLNKAVCFSKAPSGLKLATDIDNKNEFSEKNAQILRKNVEYVFLKSDGHRHRIKIYEKSRTKSWEFEGIIFNAILKEEKNQ